MPTLDWLGKDAVIKHAAHIPYHVLNRKYNFGGDTANKIIHGDNLLALRSLLPEYEGRVKCIYIDPPYNTGNENWIYNDNVNSAQIQRWLNQTVGRDDLSRHDKWLCMMYPRLSLLKKLLANDGAIFISIDDNEQANLKLLCDEVFGEQNFVANVIWQKRFSRSNDAKYFCDNHDYLTVYAKRKEIWRPNLLSRGEEIPKGYKNPDNDPRGVWTSTSLTAKSGSNAFVYEITTPNGKKFFPPTGRYWACTPQTFQKWLADNRLYFGADGNGVPRKKTFLSEVQGGLVPFTIWLRDEVGDTQESKREIKSTFNGENIFDTPKPTRLIERILQIATDKDSIVLDSFAGSGTTAHAVLNLNAQDGGNRKFILVEMEDYADNITAERVKRVIDGYGKVEGTGGSFDYYEVGEPLMVDGDLNPAVDIEQIRAYVWYTKTRKPYIKPSDNHPAFLGNDNGTAYYFHYDKNYSTRLNFEFLSTLKTRAERYVIYAEACDLDDDFMYRNNIVFKKIPRDIGR